MSGGAKTQSPRTKDREKSALTNAADKTAVTQNVSSNTALRSQQYLSHKAHFPSLRNTANAISCDLICAKGWGSQSGEQLVPN